MSAAEAITKIHTSTIDTRRAYEKARDAAERPVLQALFAEMVELRKKHHDQLHHILVEMGQSPNDEGSFMTTVHKDVVGVRAAFKGVDRDSLSSFASGEENIVKEYDEALRQSDLYVATRELLSKQKADVIEKIARMKALGDA